MSFNKKNRTDLRLYFIKNSIPTESNFADLIDGMLNQKEDGIFKLSSGDPLSIVATGDANSQQKLINFYQNLGDSDPACMLNLSPQGFSISDGQGMSRLFIDRNTGNVGIGTTSPDPNYKLNVNGSLKVAGGLKVSLQKAGDGIFLDSGNNSKAVALFTNNGPGVWNSLTQEGDHLLLWKGVKIDDPGAGLVIAPWRSSASGIRIDANGNVGIGTNSPGYALDVKSSNGIKLGLEGNGGGQLVLLNNTGDNKIYLGAFNVMGDGSAAELLLTGHGSQNVPKLSLRADTTYINGKIGIGTADPQADLSINNTTAGAAIQVDGNNGQYGLWLGADANHPWIGSKTNHDLRIITNNLEKIRITKEGNVGIGTVTPGAKLHVNGTVKVEASGLVFDGTKSYVGLPAMNPDYATGFTIEAWVCYRSFKSFSRIIDFGNGGGADNILLANLGTNNNLYFQVYRGSSPMTVTANGALELNAWMHLAATVDAAGNAVLYRNGQLLTKGTTNLPNTLSRTKNYIGRSNFPGDGYFDGYMRDVRIWNTARTAQQISNTMLAGLSGTEPNLVAWWPLDFGSRARDLGPNKFNGTIFPDAKFCQSDLTVQGDLIRKVAVATGLGPNDETDSGQIVSRVLKFTKQRTDTAIRILYCDNFRVNGNNAAARWEIRVDGSAPSGGAIYQDKYGSNGNYHEPATILGYAIGISAGVHEIQVWVDPIPGYANDAYTGWAGSRWTIEAQEVWI